MGDTGKIGPAFFERHVYPRLGADREDIALGPAHGVDFGVVDVDGTALVCATDPVFVLPGIGIERAAWFAVHILLSDVAVSGLRPTHLSLTLNLPSDLEEETFDRIWAVFDRETADLGVGIVTGHTARYEDGSFPTVGAGTAMAVGDHDAVIRPDGARPGDRVLVTKGPAIEATALLAARFEDRFRGVLPTADLEAALDRVPDMSPVRDALTAAEAGPVTAMHDATEGGLTGALLELANAGDVGLRIDRDRVPVAAGVEAVCEHVGIDPWPASSSGTLVLTVAEDGVAAVLEALEAAGTPAAAVGRVTDGTGVRVDGTSIERRPDPFWPAYAALADAA